MKPLTVSTDWGGSAVGYLWPGGYVWGPHAGVLLGRWVGMMVGRALGEAMLAAPR